MFEFYGSIGRRRFFWAATVRIGLFVASVAGFPFLLKALAIVTKCQSVGGACGALGLVASVAFKPLAFALLVFSFIGISVRRARDAGLPGWAGLFVPLLLAADQGFLVLTGAPWSLAFISGAMGPQVPRFLLLGLACIAFLCALPARETASGNSFGAPGWIAFGLALFIAAHATLVILASIPAAFPAVIALGKVLAPTLPLLPMAMIALVILLAWMAWRARGTGRSGPAHPRATGPRLPVRTLLALALLVTVGVFIAVHGPAWPIALLTQSTTAVAPTLLLYGLLVAAVFLAVTRPRPASFALLALALLPFAQWAYAHWAATKAHEKERAAIAAIATTRLTRIPATLVVESPHVAGLREAWAIPGIERVISKGAYGSGLMQFDRPPARGSAPPAQPVAALPGEYLLLRIGRASRFAVARQAYAAAGGPLELRRIDPGRDDLVAIWYRTYDPPPARLPLLTTSGWYRGTNSAVSGDIDASIRSFLSRALAAAG
ncbi:MULTISPECIES: DUF805 domain-containing protein [Rhodomicrobium]|uniref:DUF805 domain-containing protein n=1 Tax=Rhodomicrobium TaxID=1068 RepID=UPI000B4C125C|nr:MULTISPECIES: DUF805 domain-containing protein [Rhodomicrobium]